MNKRWLVGLVPIIVILALAIFSTRPGEERTLMTIRWGWWSSADFTKDMDYNGIVDVIHVGAPATVTCNWSYGVEISRLDQNGGFQEVFGTAELKEGVYRCYFPRRHPERSRELDDQDPIIVVR